jgi:adenylate cyclase
MSFWEELRRRKVVKVAVAYAIVGWLLVQVAATFFPALQLPGWTVTFVAALVILGFPIALILSWMFDLTSEGVVRTPGPIARDVSEPGVAAAATPAAAPGFLENSVAVLPLDNLSPDPDNAYFAAGLHEEILNQLAKLSGLHVISRTSVLQYAQDRPSIADIAKALNVQSIMEGSIRYARNRLRVTVQLIDSVTGGHLWSETYEREFDDVFAIESDIAMNVAKALEATFSQEEQRAVERVPTTSTEAYNLYLRLKPIRMSHLNVALNLCDQALAIDPEFALVHMAKGYLYANAIVANIGQAAVDEEERLSRFEELARYHADRALALDPSLERARLAHALIDLYGWRWSQARAAFDRVGISSQDDLGAQHYLWLCAYQGDLERAIEIGRRAVELSPNDWRARWGLATALDYAGDAASALEAQREAVALNPSLPVLHSWLAYIYVSLGENTEALGELRFTEELMGDNPDVVSLPELAYSYSRIGRTEDVERLFSEIRSRAGDHDIGAGIWSMIYLAKGDHDRAAKWIDTAIGEAGRHEIDQGFWPLMNIKMNATADPVLEEPRFVALRNRIRGD